MSSQPWERQKLIEVWLSAGEGSANDKDIAHLNELISADENVRLCLVELSQHQAWLTWNGTASDLACWDSIDAEVTAQSRAAASSLVEIITRGNEASDMADHSLPSHALPKGTSKVKSLSRMSRAFALGACLAWAITWAVFSYDDNWGRLAGKDNDSVDDSMGPVVQATIVSSTAHCVWDQRSSVRPALGQSLRGGESLQLLEGIAELSVSVGGTKARLHLEGPVAIILTAEGLPSLRYGKITIQAEGDWSASYPIETSFGRVLLKQDTDIGISSFGSVAAIHVFRGRVEVESPWLHSEAETPAIVAIHAGEALQIENVGGSSLRSEIIAADREMFTPKVSMNSDFLAVVPEYIREIVAASPIVYWRFDTVQDGLIRNEMSDRMHGRVRGTVGWTGPSGNQAIQFGVSPNPGSIVVPSESWDEVFAKGFSLEAWVKPSHYHLGSIFGFVGESEQQNDRHMAKDMHGILVEVCGTSQPSSWHKPRRIRFLHRSPLSFNVEDGVSCFSDETYVPRRWQHIVAVKDGELMRLYLDGKLSHKARDPSNTPSGLQLVMGQLYATTVHRFFIGDVDEVAIYDRPISAEEIERHYRLLRPGLELRGDARPNSHTEPSENRAEQRIAI